MRLLRPLVLASAAAALVGCASSGRSSDGVQPPATYRGLLLRTDVRLSEEQWPKALCRPGWKRDPDRDGFLINDWDEEMYAELNWRHAHIKYAAYAPPSAADRSTPDREAPLRIGAWRHRRWWVEPEWAELDVLRTDLALARAPGAATLTRLALSPGGVVDEEPTDILRLGVARFGDKPSPYRDRPFAVLSEGSSLTVGLLDDDHRVVARVEHVDPESVVRLGFDGYLFTTEADGERLHHIVDDAGAPLAEPFSRLAWYSPPPVKDQADPSMSYQTTYLMPTDPPPEVASAVRAKLDGKLYWPVALSGEFVPQPEYCFGAAYLGSRTWVAYWDTPAGVRLSFSDTGHPAVEDLAASSERARWVDWEIAWTQFLPHSTRSWVLQVAEETGSGERVWRAYRDADCTWPTALGDRTWPTREALGAELQQRELAVLEDEERIDAQRALAASSEIVPGSEGVASTAMTVAPPAAPRQVDCGRCGGKGFLVSMRDYTTWYTPVVTNRNGLQFTSRTSITTTRPHYDGVCGACGGKGWVAVR